MYENLYSKITDALVKDGYIIIKNALDKQLCRSLYDFAKLERGFKQAGISSSSDLHLDPNRRRDKIFWLNEGNSIENNFLLFVGGLKEYLNRSLYLGLKYHEAHFAIYDKGDFYEKHLDPFKNSKNRVVTTVYYLNEDWDENNGGELIIYNKNDEFLTKVSPDANTLVVFMSEDFPHEVLPAKTKRYSIAGWYRVD
jgi:SM-20-related protein